jgi:hypothetical protein
MRTIIPTASLLVFLGVVGCGSKSESRSEIAQVASANQVLDQTLIPVKEDFEEKARNTVDEVNLDEQLNQIEQDIAVDETSGG